VFGACLAAVSCGCASSEPAAVVQAGTRSLKCPRSEVETMLNRETPKVREYLVGCDFMYTRVHCTAAGCYLAKPRPVCLEGVPCLEEDPVTLEWRLPETTHPLAKPAG
jgi:hypothetical protein